MYCIIIIHPWLFDKVVFTCKHPRMCIYYGLGGGLSPVDITIHVCTVDTYIQ